MEKFGRYVASFHNVTAWQSFVFTFLKVSPLADSENMQENDDSGDETSQHIETGEIENEHDGSSQGQEGTVSGQDINF